MNDTYIVTSYVVIDDILKAYGVEDDCRAQGTAAEILTVAVMAAKYFQNHHERAIGIMTLYWLPATSSQFFKSNSIKRPIGSDDASHQGSGHSIPCRWTGAQQERDEPGVADECLDAGMRC
jgi:hypothetical protein